MRKAFGCIVAAACIVCMGGRAAAEDLTGKVALVASGHILQVEHDGKRELVVINGVLSPDSKTPAGKLAKAFVANRALEQDVKVTVVKRSERIVTGTVFLADGKDLAEIILSEGMGTWNRLAAPDNTVYRDVEAGAKMQKLGLWGMEHAESAAAQAPKAAAVRVETANTDAATKNAPDEGSADGKHPKLVLRGDADLAEATHAQFEKEKQAATEQRQRLLAEQQKMLEEQEKKLADQQKKEEAAAAQAEQGNLRQQGGLPPQQVQQGTAPNVMPVVPPQ